MKNSNQPIDIWHTEHNAITSMYFYVRTHISTFGTSFYNIFGVGVSQGRVRVKVGLGFYMCVLTHFDAL